MTGAEGVELVVEEVVLEPGSDTGWHFHESPLLVVVLAGTLTREDARGRTTVHRPGDVLVEPAGAGHVHRGVNASVEPVVLSAACALRPGQLRATPAAAPLDAYAAAGRPRRR